MTVLKVEDNKLDANTITQLLILPNETQNRVKKNMPKDRKHTNALV